MSLRLVALTLPLTLALTLAACQSSGRYGTPTHAAVGTGIAVAGAAAVRASGGCWAQCLPGTICNPVTGLCERADLKPAPAPALGGAPAPHVVRRPLSASASYPPGHEFDVPPAPVADAGCDPTSSSGGGLSCEMDGATSY